jgi:hypothetical protein
MGGLTRQRRGPGRLVLSLDWLIKVLGRVLRAHRPSSFVFPRRRLPHLVDKPSQGCTFAANGTDHNDSGTGGYSLRIRAYPRMRPPIAIGGSLIGSRVREPVGDGT